MENLTVEICQVDCIHLEYVWISLHCINDCSVFDWQPMFLCGHNIIPHIGTHRYFWKVTTVLSWSNMDNVIHQISLVIHWISIDQTNYPVVKWKFCNTLILWFRRSYILSYLIPLIFKMLYPKSLLNFVISTT